MLVILDTPKGRVTFNELTPRASSLITRIHSSDYKIEEKDNRVEIVFKPIKFTAVYRRMMSLRSSVVTVTETTEQGKRRVTRGVLDVVPTNDELIVVIKPVVVEVGGYRTPYEILERHYPQALERLKEGFEGFLETAKKVEIVPWRDEYAVADKNPEIVLQLEELEEKLKNGEITEEAYMEATRKILTAPASPIVGVAFINYKKVSFRKVPPPLKVLLHEVGHVHFKVGDLFWNSTFGGAEILLQAHVAKICNSDEERVKKLIGLLKLAHEDPQEAHSMMIDALKRFIAQNGIYPHIGAVMAHLGCLIVEDAPIDSEDPAWKNFSITTNLILHAITEILAGVCVSDPSFIYVAKHLGWLEEVK